MLERSYHLLVTIAFEITGLRVAYPNIDVMASNIPNIISMMPSMKASKKPMIISRNPSADPMLGAASPMTPVVNTEATYRLNPATSMKTSEPMSMSDATEERIRIQVGLSSLFPNVVTS